MTDRIPCINPRCRRTAALEKFPDACEIICSRCFRALPAKLRSDHRLYWREIRKWQRRIARTSDVIKIARMKDILSRWEFRLDMNWSRIRTRVLSPEKPVGLEAFFEEIGL